MLPARVMLLRLAALIAVSGAFGAPAALGATGGAGLPGGGVATAAAPAQSTVPDDLSAVAAAPATTPATGDGAEAATTSLTNGTPAIPVLATAARRIDDPVTQDLAALPAPSAIAAIDGHVVVVRPRGALSDLVDLLDPTAPRTLLTSTRTFGTPLAGRDATGRPVVVVSPCAGAVATVSSGMTPRCPLRSIDLQTGASTALASTTGALAGDLSGTRLLFSRISPQTGVRLYETVAGTALTAIPLPKLGKPGDGWTAATGVPLAGTLRAASFDVDAAGRIAVALDYVAHAPKFSSGLWMRSAAGVWSRTAVVNTSFTGMGTRHVLGPLLDATGVTAYVEGIVDAPSYLGRWTDAGEQTTKTSLRRSIGRSTILDATAYDSGRLLFVDWLPGAPCGSEESLACGLRSVGPVAVS